MKIDPENRRNFVKKSLATSMTITFAGLIRAHGDGGGQTTTFDLENTYVTTSPTPIPKVIGTQSGQVVRPYSTGWWYKAKIVVSAPNPNNTVTITVRAAGAEKGSGGGAVPPPEEVGPMVSITGSVDPSGVFSSAHSGVIGEAKIGVIGFKPANPSPMDLVWAAISSDSVITGVDATGKYFITMKGKVWAFFGEEEGAAKAPTPKDDWEVTVKRL